MNEITLFCLPFAGGNKYSYREYVKHLPSGIKIITLEYPGRGARQKETFISDAHLLVDDLFLQIKDLLKTCSYALYGHSMGGLLAALLVKKIFSEKLPLPLHVFITGTTGPASRLGNTATTYDLNRKEFIDKIKKLQGLPDEVLSNDELLDYFEPILRVDFKASERYVYSKSPPLPVRYMVITGDKEDFKLAEIQSWQEESEYEVDFRQLSGAHFFIIPHSKLIMSIISRKILEVI